MRSKGKETKNLRKDSAVYSFWPNRLAPETKELLYNGLERLVNVGDSFDEYSTLAREGESFWPLDTVDMEGRSIRWAPAAHDLFIVFRDYLRRIWVSDRESIDHGHLDILLGLSNTFADHPEPQYRSFQTKELHKAWAELTKSYGNCGVATRPLVTPSWGTGAFSYVPINDFQRAVYQLFVESWRAKRCARCSRYFIADKPAQIYCSTACSGGVKLVRAREWWNREGTKRRASRQRKSHKKTDHH